MLIAGSPPGSSAQGVGQRSRMVAGYFEVFGYSEDVGNAASWAAGRWRPPTMLHNDWLALKKVAIISPRVREGRPTRRIAHPRRCVHAPA